MIRIALAITVLGLSSLQPVAAQNPPSNVRWKKTVIDRVFRSEGVAVADVNKDGKMDILVGDFWYEAPDWKIHPIRRVKDFNPTSLANGYYGDPHKNYSQCMCCWAEDINGDGWMDQVVVGFPGKPAFWYENPKGQPGEWKEHMIWPTACNETPQYVDLFGTGKRVLVMGVQPKGKDHEGQMAWLRPGSDPTALWEMHPISEPSTPEKEIPGTYHFAHGMGIGDINGDGRLDVACTRAGLKNPKAGNGGWWEQPAKDDGKTPWTFHPADFHDAVADMIVCDINGDGKADVISSSAHQFGIWAHLQRPGKDGPHFLRTDLFPKLVSETHAMHYVDIDGDGLKDLVTGKRFWSHGRSEPGADDPARLYWFQAKKSSDGMITFTPHIVDEDSGIGTQFVVTDFNGDGRPDIVVANKKGVFLFEQIPAK